MAERIEVLTTTRAAAADAQAAELRRIERDLHDGAQARLVALAMDLGMARERMDTAPEEARALVVEAHDEAKRALVELRDLARGIHPAVLTDRGLAAAHRVAGGHQPDPDRRAHLARRPPGAGHRGRGLLHGLRGARQRRQAQPRRRDQRQRGARR